MADPKWTTVGNFDYIVAGVSAAGRNRAILADTRTQLNDRIAAIMKLQGLKFAVKRRLTAGPDGTHGAETVIYNAPSAPTAAKLEKSSGNIRLNMAHDLLKTATPEERRTIEETAGLYADYPIDAVTFTCGLEGMSIILVRDLDPATLAHVVIHNTNVVSPLNAMAYSAYLSRVIEHMTAHNVHVMELLLVNSKTAAFTVDPPAPGGVHVLPDLSADIEYFGLVRNAVDVAGRHVVQDRLAKAELGLVVMPEMTIAEAKDYLAQERAFVIVRTKAPDGPMYALYSDNVDTVRRFGGLIFPYGGVPLFTPSKNELRVHAMLNHVRAATIISDYPISDGVYDPTRHSKMNLPVNVDFETRMSEIFTDEDKRRNVGTYIVDAYMNCLGDPVSHRCDFSDMIEITHKGTQSDSNYFWTMQRIMTTHTDPGQIWAHALARTHMMRVVMNMITVTMPRRTDIHGMFVLACREYLSYVQKLYVMLKDTVMVPRDGEAVNAISRRIIKAYGGPHAVAWFRNVTPEYRNALLFLFGVQLLPYGDGLTLDHLVDEIHDSLVPADLYERSDLRVTAMNTAMQGQSWPVGYAGEKPAGAFVMTRVGTPQPAHVRIDGGEPIPVAHVELFLQPADYAARMAARGFTPVVGPDGAQSMVWADGDAYVFYLLDIEFTEGDPMMMYLHFA